MPVLEDADTEGNKEDVAVMEEAVEDLPDCCFFCFGFFFGRRSFTQHAC